MMISPSRSITPLGDSARRIYALITRYMYLLKGSWPRLIELGYWPTVQVCLWGFMTLFLAEHTSYIARDESVDAPGRVP